MRSQVPWLRVLIEGVVIVGSILLAFGIDAGWEGRQERAEEAEYLQRLDAELVANHQMLEEMRAVYATTREHSYLALRFMASGRIDTSSDTALVTFYSASRSATPGFQGSVYEELISTGRLSLLRSRELRSALVHYQVEAEFLTDQFSGWDDRKPYRTRMRRIVPPELQAAIIQACSDLEPLSCAPRLDSGVASAVVDRLMQDRELHDDLVLWTASQSNLVTLTEQAISATEGLLGLLRAP